jgi:uncharacterized protein (TIGR02118 family)
MVRFLVLYQPPTDAEAFEKHYVGFHVPLAKRLPGLRWKTGRKAERCPVPRG